MIVKSLSRSSNTTGQLLKYIFRYVLEKEPRATEEKEAPKTAVISKSDIPFYQQAYLDGNLTIEQLPDQAASIQRDFAEQELDGAVRITKSSVIGKEIVKSHKAQGIDLRKTAIYLTPNYIITRSKDREQFFRVSLHDLFSRAKQVEKEKQPPFIIRHNLRSRSINGYIREFEKIESLRVNKRSNNILVYHTILSFSSKDKEQITDAMLTDMVNKYIELRGPNNLYVGTKHTDKDHIHIHIAMSSLDIAGRSVRMSQANFQALKIELDRYQAERYPELRHSLPAHGTKGKQIVRESLEKNIKIQRTTDRETLLKVLESTYAKSSSTDHFLSQLQEQGYPAYYRCGSLTGVSVEGRKFRLARLGYDQQKLKSLDQVRDKEEEELSTLRSLRQNSARDHSHSPTDTLRESVQQDIELSGQLEELQSLRDGRDSPRDRDDENTAKDRQSDRNEDDRDQEINLHDTSQSEDARDR